MVRHYDYGSAIHSNVALTGHWLAPSGHYHMRQLSHTDSRSHCVGGWGEEQNQAGADQILFWQPDWAVKHNVDRGITQMLFEKKEDSLRPKSTNWASTQRRPKPSRGRLSHSCWESRKSWESSPAWSKERASDQGWGAAAGISDEQ